MAIWASFYVDLWALSFYHYENIIVLYFITYRDYYKSHKFIMIIVNHIILC